MRKRCVFERKAGGGRRESSRLLVACETVEERGTKRGGKQSPGQAKKLTE